MLEGTVHPDFVDVATSLRRIMPRKGPGGAAACVYYDGEKVVDLWGGTRNRAGDPWESDTVSISFSTTKGIASTLLHMYVDRGAIDLDAPVATYWPEFAQAGKEAITVRQVMCHEAGLYGLADMVEHGNEMLDWDRMIERLSAATPRHAPGAAHGYHAMTYGWLAGELVRRVAGGKPFSELLENEIARPLGLDGLFCGVPADQQHRCAELIAAGMDGTPEQRVDRMEKIQKQAARFARVLRFFRIPWDPTHSVAALVAPKMDEVDFNSEAFRAASIPAANGMFTARSLARLYACLARGGELDGVRLLSEAAVDRAAEEQNRGVGRVIPVSMRWRLGYHRVFAMGARMPHGFGHFGFGGSGAFAEPARKLSVALTVNSGVGTPFGDSRIARIGGAAARCVDRLSGTPQLTPAGPVT